mgnify:CR=1 FL=1
MKSSKILLAGIVLVVAFGLAGYGTVQKKEEMKAPAAVAVKAGKLLGCSVKDKSVFLAEGIAYYKGDLIVINNAEGNLIAYRFSKNKVEINKGFFKDGIYAGERGIV